MNVFRPYLYRSGMTLVEVIVVIAIYAVLMISVTSTVSFLYQTNSYAVAQAQEVDTARRGLTTWTKDAREMIPSAEGTWPVAIMEPNRIGFYSDVDKDSVIEYVVYSLASTTLYKYTYEPSATSSYSTSTPSRTFIISEFVQNLVQATSTFRYFNAAGVAVAPTGLLTDVRYIQVHLIVNIDPIRSPGEFVLRSSAAPRNLKDNL
ncbi:prepilin-type N-terminal cleavage/methylation domain-containing protein [Patescibacteria group bacterium]|nr:prepilin-type N-terminal cleavage/methylation domain-containing protein [Patescibacteria group bacterium]